MDTRHTIRSIGDGPTTNSQKEENEGKKNFSFRMLLLTILVLQNSITVLLGRYTREANDKESLYSIGEFIFVSEFFKLATSVLLELSSGKGFSCPDDLLKMSIPAVCYCASNTLLYMALSNLSVPVFQVMSQSKLVITAVVSVVMLKRRYCLRQWICLVIISISLAILTLEEKNATNHETNAQSNEIFITGLLAIFFSCLMSSFAGVYLEKILKTKTKNTPSIWMRNIQLAFWSIIVAVLQQSIQGEFSARKTPFLHGFTPMVWCQVFLFSGGGLLVSIVIKYADSVLKGIAIGLSVLISTSASMTLYDTSVSSFFPLCALSIIGAVYYFSNDKPSFRTKKKCFLPLVSLLLLSIFISNLFQKKITLLNMEKNEFQFTKVVEKSVFPSDWNSTKEALDKLRFIQNGIQERSFHEATHILYDLRTHLGDRPVKYLEIGSYTGISSSLVMNHPFPTYATLVDPCRLPKSHFKGTVDQESTIRKNIAKMVPNKFCKLTRPWELNVGFSPTALPFGETFDIIFIDGDHSTEGVWADYNNTVSLLRPGGFMVFDDYLDWQYSRDVRPAVDNIAKITDLIPIGTLRNIHDIHPHVNSSFINEFIFQKAGNFKYYSPMLTSGLDSFEPVLCVTVATYRRPDGSTPSKLEKIWKMLQQQSYKNWKLYLTGDHYDDDVEWKSLSFFNNNRVKIYNLPEPGERGKLSKKELWLNAGAGAMNNAIDRVLADGHEWIVHLDDDDTWDIDHLHNILAGIRTGATFVMTWCQFLRMERPLPTVSNIYSITHTVIPKQCDTIHSSIAFNAAKISTRYKRFPGHAADSAMWTRIQYDEGFYPAFVPVQSCYHLRESNSEDATAIVRKSILRDIDPPPGWHGIVANTTAYHTLATNDFPLNLSTSCKYVIGPEIIPKEQTIFQRLQDDEIPYHIRAVKEFAHFPVWGKMH